MTEGHPALIGSCEEHTALLVERYSAPLVGLCSRLLRDRDLAQDAVQETFLKAYLKRGSFRGENEKSEKAWLMQIAANICRDQMRTSWFRLADSKGALDALNRAAVEVSEEAILLRIMIGSLPRKYSEVIWMYYYQDMTVCEIAAVVKRSTAVVYRRLREARQMLRASMKPE